VKIPTTTISTGDAKRTDGQRSRDEHLRTTDFFSVAEFPDMTFKSTRMNFAGDKIQSVEGTGRRSRPQRVRLDLKPEPS